MPLTAAARYEIIDGAMVPVGYEQLTAAIASAAAGLTVPAGANIALIQSETANVRWRDDGGSPTTSLGMILPTGLAPFKYTGDLTKLQFIAAASNAVLNVSYYFSG